MDRRFFPANERVVLEGFSDHAPGKLVVARARCAMAKTVTALRDGPDGKRDRELLLGDRVQVLETVNGWSFVRAEKDGYVGYVSEASLGPAIEATHFVATRSTHAYDAPDVKAPDRYALSFGSRVQVVSEERRHLELHDGTYVPKSHLRPVEVTFQDMVTVAQLFFGTPYLWGGNSAWGIDCSGLVQIAALATGCACPPDSDLQAAGFGDEVAMDAPIERGDFFYWTGHVAIAVDAGTLIHANAHHMAVAYEPLETALVRIEAQEGAGVTVRRRL